MESIYFFVWLYQLIIFIGLAIFFLITGFSVVRCLILCLISCSMWFVLLKYLNLES